ncbi:hypothetical protein OXX79_006298 [Metschnikowia pulcherrima]
MSGNGLLSDPAIIGISSPSEAVPGDGHAPRKSGLEPGSALSKLLDSAVANAAREATPEPETAGDSEKNGPSEPRSNRSSFQSFVPQFKADLSRIYSINALLELRSSPAVLEFDVSQLPEATFWRTKQRDNHANGKHNGQNENNNHAHGTPSSGGKGKRSRRNQLAAQNAADSLNWDRKPAGFLKTSDIDNMSTEKISQLLGEAPEEETPDWDLPGANADMRIEMGNTVEDFERWKSHMRQEEKRKHGELEPFHETEEAQPANEVDSFFSFVNPKDAAPDQTSFPFNKQADSKSSRFSSFFGGPGPSAESRKAVANPEPLTAQTTAKSDHSAGGSRFFNGEPQNSPQTQSPGLPQSSQDKHRHGPPPGMPPKFQGPGNGIASSPAVRMPGMPSQSNPPPGFRMNPGPPSGPGLMMHPGARGPANNDSFFLSLMSKGEIGPNGEVAGPMAMFSQQSKPSVDNKQPSEQGQALGSHMRGPEKFGESSYAGPTAPNSSHTGPPAFRQYQDAPMGLPQQQMGMNIPPGMKPMGGAQIPPGMFPPGMFPPAAQAHPNQGPNSQVPNQRSFPGQKGTPQLNRQEMPGAQIRGEMPPPWMRFGPGGPAGMAPPGFPQMPPGFPPGYSQVPSNTQQK